MFWEALGQALSPPGGPSAKGTLGDHRPNLAPHEFWNL